MPKITQHHSRGHVWYAPPDIDIAIQSVSEEFNLRPQPDFTIRHAFWILGYSYVPGPLVRVGSGTKAWRPWDAYSAMLHPPLIPFWHDLRENRTTQHGAWTAFKGGDKLGLQKFVRHRQVAARFLDPENILGRHLQAMARSASTGKEAVYWSVQAGLLQAVQLLHNAEPVEDGVYLITSRSARSLESELVSQVQRFLRSNLARSLRRRDIARHAGISLSKLAHLYGAATGEGPMTTLLRMRVEAARERLLQGDSVKTASEQTGFSSPYHLSRAFKELLGLPPRDFLKRFASR